MRITTAALGGLGLLAFAACTSAPAPLTEADRAAIRALDSAFAAAVTAGDLEGMLAPFTPDAMVMPQGAGIAAGQTAIRELFSGMASEGGRVQLTSTTGTIEGAGDLAYATGSYEIRSVPTDSTQPPYVEVGKWLGVYHRMEDGSWKMVRDMWNTNAPPPAPAPAAPTRR